MNNDAIKLTEYDKMSFDGNTQMLKAMLPYMPPGIQPGLAYTIIFKEFSNLRRTIRNNYGDELGICALDNPKTSLTDILKDIRQYAGKKQQNHIDMLLNMMQTMSLYQQYMQIASMGAPQSNDNFDASIDKLFAQLSNEKMGMSKT